MRDRAVIINLKGGIAMGMDRAGIEAKFADAWPAGANIIFAERGKLPELVMDTFADDRFASVVVAGGDGTASLAAKAAVAHDKPFGIVPLGTMNLFARTIGMPLDPDEAIASLAQPDLRHVDCGEANGTVFINHVSLGFHPQLVRMRDAIPRASRLKRMYNGARVYLRLMQHHRRLRLSVEGDFPAFGAEAGLVVVSINPIEEGVAQIPHPDGQRRGEFGLYISTHKSAWDLNKVVWRLLNGTLRESEHVAFRRTARARIAARSAVHMSVDGEIQIARSPIECIMRAGGLKVLVPPAES